jgi:hypothetical protein
MPGIGFKIADGYVEVHAHYDKGELEKAATQAAAGSGDAFNKETVRHSRSSETRNVWRLYGGRAGDSFVRGMRDQIARHKTSPLISIDGINQQMSRLGRVSVRPFGNAFAEELSRILASKVEQQVDRRRSLFARAGIRIAGHIRTGLIGPRGAPAAAAGFMRNFIEAITFGQADFGRVNTAGLARVFAGIGTAVGAVFAAALVLEIANAITALLPLALAGIAAVPIIHLLKTKEFKDEIKALKEEWKSFISFVSSPLKIPLQQALVEIMNGLNRLRVPLARFFRAIGDALPTFTKGVMDAIVAFFRALQPLLDNGTIQAALKTWATELPRIATALGQMVTAILKDPATVSSAIKAFTDFFILTSRVLGVVIPLLTRFNQAMHGMTSALVLGAQAARGVQAAWQWLVTKLGEAWASLQLRLSQAAAAIKRTWDAVVAFFRSIPGKVAAALASLKAKIITPFEQAHDRVRAKVEGMIKSVVAFFKSLPGKVASAISTLWSRMTGAFNRAVTGARQKATDLVNRVVAFLRTLPGKAASAVAALWSRMISAFTRAVTGARQKAVDLVNRFVAFLRTLPGKAASAVRGVRSAILGVFAGAGSWLLGAGRQIVAGLAAGIRGGVSSVISAAVSVARSAISAAKSALGISSPSKVFAEQVGKPIAQGIGLGMRRNIKDEFKELPGMLPQLGGNRGTSSSARSYSSTFNPTINVHVAAGLDPVDGAARRALVKGLYLETEKFRKDYVK